MFGVLAEWLAHFRAVDAFEADGDVPLVVKDVEGVSVNDTDNFGGELGSGNGGAKTIGQNQRENVAQLF